ncbi:MAG: glycosyltransferase family 39 protein [Phycisphaerae bacterium]
MEATKGHQEPLPANAALPGPKSLVIAGLLCLLLFLNGLNDAVQNSAVADEVGGHMASGYLYWLSGKYSGGIANFPLAHLLIALPVVVLGYSYELFSEQHLVLFRLPVLLMGLLLGIVLYRFTMELFGRKAALAALFLFSLSPNILTHASLATLDLPIAFFVFLTIYALWRYVRRPHWARMLALSLALACALTTKVQAILLIPIVLFVLAVSFGHRPLHRTGPAIFLWSWIFLPLVPWVFINSVYLNIPPHSGHLLPILFVEALQRKLLHAGGTVSHLQVAYLMGQHSSDGWWYYFPFAILVKTPLPTLALLGLGIVRKQTRESLLFVLLPVVVFLGVAMAASLNIGLRHVLTIYPFLFMLAGKGAESLWRRSWRGGALIVLGAGYLGQAAMIAPHHLSYFNLLAGGPRNGHKLLIGSNYDAGQNDHFLRRYIEERGIAYKINPDPFRPTTGHILVKANAFYGSYGGGGPAAYAWLKRFEPVSQIAYTWFEYDIPEDAHLDGEEAGEHIRPIGRKHPFRPWNENDVDDRQFDAALAQIERYLHGLRNRFDGITDPRFRLALAEAFVATAAYESALNEARLLLERDPGFGPAVGLGGELMVCWKVGVLKFEGDQYLTGFRAEHIKDDVPPPDVASLAHYSSVAGISAQISQLHHKLGTVLEEQGRTAEATEQYRRAVRIASPTRGSMGASPRPS